MSLGASILEKSDEEILALAHQLRVAYGMKRTLRYDTVRDFTVHSESDAEHVFGLIFLATYFVPLEEAGKEIDATKLYEMLLYHDFGEIIHGDAVTYYKTKEHVDRETEDAKKVFASLPATLSDRAKNLWLEYEEHKTPEARFAYVLDKTEPLFELLDPVNEDSMKRLKVTHAMHLSHKMKAVEGFPVIKRFTEVISQDMNNRGVFWKEE